MSALIGESSRTTTTSAVDLLAVSRGLHAAFARERLAEESDLRRAVDEIAEATALLLGGALSELLETAPPRLIGRLAARPRFADRS
jgi:hypothetical protein